MVVIKYGGSVMIDEDLRLQMAQNIARLAKEGQKPIVIHGGGPFIKKALEKQGIVSEFVQGLRKTTLESISIIEQVLTQLNKILSQDIGKAIGLTGRDNSLLLAKQREGLGFVGDVTKVNTGFIKSLLELKLTPVIACLAATETGRGILNVNGDSVAGAVAGALTAPVIFLSDVSGILDHPEDSTSLIDKISAKNIDARIKQGKIVGGMIPKVEAAVNALKKGASFAIITDGRKSENLLLALQNKSGTRITLGV